MARRGLHTNIDKDDSEGSDEVSEQDDSVTGTKIPINPVPVAMKTPSIATYTIIKQGEKGAYQIVREDGTDIVYINFGAMLKAISRDDLTELYRIVMNSYALKNSCCKDKKRRLEVLQIKNNLKNSIYNILRKLKVFKVKIKNVLKELEVHNQSFGVRLINEDKGRQDVLLNLAFQFEDSCAVRDDLRKTYEKCNDISQESRALICTLLKESSEKDRELHLSMYGKAAQLQKQMDAKSAWFQEKYSVKELHQLRMDEEALKEMLEEEAMNKKAQEEKIRQEQAENDAFFLEFGVIKMSYLVPLIAVVFVVVVGLLLVSCFTEDDYQYIVVYWALLCSLSIVAISGESLEE
ncbi:hypothetical protein Tco_0311875 [Tanacetum coccineum]